MIHNALPSEIEAMRPPEDIPIWQHGEKYCTLPKDSPIKGMWIASIQPYVLPILRWAMEPKIHEINICKNSQGGVSVVCQVICGYFIEQEPSPIMVILADQGTAEFVSDNRYQHMFTSHPRYLDLMDTARWTRERMNFLNGAYLEMGWASSVAKMGTRSIRIVIADEIDKRGYNVVTAEGETLKLPESRLKTYRELSTAKYVKLSTPTDENGNIARQIRSSDIVFDCPAECPKCRQIQPLNWWFDPKKNHWFKDGVYHDFDGNSHKLGRVIWEGGREATNEQIQNTTRYECGECGAYWTETERRNAVRAGIERCEPYGGALPRTKPRGDEISIGYVVSDLGSMLTSMVSMVEAWVKIFRETNKLKRDKALQDFVNSRLGEPFEQVTMQTTSHEVLNARTILAPGEVPENTVALTCGIDHQAASFYYTVWAWLQVVNNVYVGHLIDHDVLYHWEDVASLLFTTKYDDFSIWRAAIDTGGTKIEGHDASMVEDAYRWISQNKLGPNGCRVFATKGSSTPLGKKIAMGAKLTSMPSGKAIPGGLQLYLIDTEIVKDLFLARLANAASGDPGDKAYLHSGADDLLARHLSSERKERDKDGNERYVKLHDDNHWLDASIMAHVLADWQWPGRGIERIGVAPAPHPHQVRHEENAPRRSPVMPSMQGHSALGGRTVNPNYARRLV